MSVGIEAIEVVVIVPETTTTGLTIVVSTSPLAVGVGWGNVKGFPVPPRVLVGPGVMCIVVKGWPVACV